jgi:chromosome segregation ATPase
MRGL